MRYATRRRILETLYGIRSRYSNDTEPGRLMRRHSVAWFVAHAIATECVTCTVTRSLAIGAVLGAFWTLVVILTWHLG